MTARRGYRVVDTIFLDRNAADLDALKRTEATFNVEDRQKWEFKAEVVWFVETEGGQAVVLLGVPLDLNREKMP